MIHIRTSPTSFALVAILTCVLAGAAVADTPKSKADQLFSKRDDAKSLEQAIDAYEAAGNHLMVARGAFQRIDLHDDLKDDDDARERWVDRGLKAGHAALGGGTPPEEREKFDKKDAEALFWYTALYGRKVELANIFRRPGMAGKFFELMKRLAALDGGVFYGGPHRILGNFYADAPGFMGGDKDKAKEEIEKAVKVAPDFLENRVARAEYVHLKRNDKAAFEKDLRAVLDAPDDVIPDVIPEQKRAKAAARELLKKGI